MIGIQDPGNNKNEPGHNYPFSNMEMRQSEPVFNLLLTWS